MLYQKAFQISTEGNKTMKKVRHIAWVGVVVVGLCASAMSQSTTRKASGDKDTRVSDQSQAVVVDKDNFSGATTITLKPQKLIDTPNHQLTMAAEVKLEGKTYAGVTGVDETVILELISRSKERVDYGDEELHFLVDGKQVRGGPTAGGTYQPDLPSDDSGYGFKGGTRYTGGVSLSKLQQIVKGRSVGLRFGSVKLMLDEKVLSNLRDFVRATNSK
ncbi:MAG: hypothetical protein ACRD4L_12940 [Pyrinomonadaceae bacterium]